METIKSSVCSILTLMFFLLSSSFINAQKYVVKNGTAFFQTKVSINSYIGTSNELTGFIDFGTGALEFSIPSKSIETPNKKRNKHMYELIKVDEYGMVTFKGNLVDLYDINLMEKQTLKINGNFTLAGETKKITLTIDLSKEQNGLRLNAEWSLLITDYGLERPTKVFFKVDDKHEMAVDAFLEIEPLIKIDKN